MAVHFREKARIAYETMPADLKERASQVISLLEKNELDSSTTKQVQIGRLKDHTDTWVVRLGTSSRLLFRKDKQGFLIIDIIDLSKEDCGAYSA